MKGIIMKSKEQLLKEFFDKVNKDSKYSPYSRLEIISIEMFAQWLVTKGVLDND